MCFPSKPPCGFADAWHLPQIRPPKVQAPTPQWPQREQAQHGGFEKTKVSKIKNDPNDLSNMTPQLLELKINFSHVAMWK
jgi:hypothetical protein